MRVLIVDDSKTMRSIVRNTLVGLGYSDIEEACDGLDALSKVAAFKPVLILLDWNMPNKSGIEFLSEYRGAGGEAAVIMVTVEAERSRVVEAIRAGANDYVVKPFSPEVLGEHVQRVLKKASLA